MTHRILVLPEPGMYGDWKDWAAAVNVALAEWSQIEDDEEIVVEEPVVGLIHAVDQKAAGTNGGTPTAGAFTNHILNSALRNDITGASLGSNLVTLPAGKYRYSGWFSCYGVGFVKGRLRDTTAGATLGESRSAWASTDHDEAIELQGEFDLAVESAVALQYWVETATATFGLGNAVSQGPEIYASLMIEKVA